MNIALLSTGFLGRKEATAITLIDFAKELVKNGEKVTIISEKRQEAIRSETIEGIPIYRIGFSGKRGLSQNFFSLHASVYNKILAHALAIRKIGARNKENFDIIHSFSAAPILALRAILSRLFNGKAKTIHTLKSYSREDLGKSFFKILNFVDIVTVPTKIFAKKLVHHGVREDKIRIITSHINTAKFIPRDRKKLKQDYGFNKKRIILYYGSMWKNKGTDILAKAIPLLINETKDNLFLFLPRNWPYARKYEFLWNAYPERIRCIANEVKIEDYVALADLVVLPYLTLEGTEGNPSCLLEAMAAKTPVVTSELEELQEITNGSVLMVKPNDAQLLAEKIKAALNNYPRKLIEKAYLEAQKYSVEKVSLQFLDLYSQLASS